MKLVFVSAGLKAPKKNDTTVARHQRYLNYGLLSLANSETVDAGSVFHGHFDQPAHTLEQVARRYGSGLIGFLLSCPSFLSLGWAQEFVELASRRFPEAKWIVGGRWVVDGNSAEIKRLLPQIAAVQEGIGEPNISNIVRAHFGVALEPTKRASEAYRTGQLSYLDYRKLFDPEAFVPSFEGSRGCGAGCSFCAEAAVKLTALKDPTVLCSEMDAYLRHASSPVRRFYLEASNFTPQLNWIEAFQAARLKFGLEDVTWRTDSRVDQFSIRVVDALARAGLRVLDLGLESASPRQLLRMKKTKNPSPYLARCSRLMKAAADVGLSVKLNILLYPGEDEQSVLETVEWLSAHKKYFTGVSAYPTVYYGFQPENESLISYYRSLGASVATDLDGQQTPGVFNLNLSKSLPYPHSTEVARTISQRFMTDEEYFELKSFSYFDPRYTRDAFLNDIRNSDPRDLSFRVTVAS